MFVTHTPAVFAIRFKRSESSCYVKRLLVDQRQIAASDECAIFVLADDVLALLQFDLNFPAVRTLTNW